MMTRDDVPARFHRIYDSAMRGKSRKAAITAHCLMCVGWERKAAVECTATGCPLYPHRPKSRPKAK